MPELPEERFLVEEPFTACGVDYSGPHLIIRGRGTEKVWVILFTCMVSRAIELQIVPNLEAVTFIKALDGLTKQYSQPKLILSDQATCFIGADKILRELSNNFQVKNDLATRGITWKFTPVATPHFGAVYERLIGVMKREMEKMFGNTKLSWYDFEMALKDIKGIINNRPLTEVNKEEVITPKNILTGKNNVDLDILNVVGSEELLESAIISQGFIPQICKNMEARKETFWKNISDQYFESLRFANTQNPGKPGLIPQQGDIVIIYDEKNRLSWKKGIIMDLIKSSDGQVRSAVVKVGTIESVKSIGHLYSLECRAQGEVENYRSKKGFRGFEQEEKEKTLAEKRIKALRNAIKLKPEK